jgi:transcriptional regulator with XRE-family HTH domain
MADDETHWAEQLLATSIQSSGLSERELEKRLGWKRGTLGKILHNGTPLAHHQVLDILAVLGREGGAVSLAGGGGPMVGTLLERFGRLGYPASPPPIAADSGEPLPQGAELERKVEEVLAEAFGHLESEDEEE